MSRHTTTITVQDVPVTVMQIDQSDYISLTDMAKARTDSTRAADVIKNWLRTRSTLEFLGTWEVMYNPNFKVVEFDHFKNGAGLHTFTLSAKEWIEKANAIGMYVQAGRYGGTYAHKDIATTPRFRRCRETSCMWIMNAAPGGTWTMTRRQCPMKIWTAIKLVAQITRFVIQWTHT